MRSVFGFWRTSDDVEVGLLQMIFLHNARGRGESALAGFMARAFLRLAERLSIGDAVGSGETERGVLHLRGSLWRGKEKSRERKNGQPGGHVEARDDQPIFSTAIL